MAWGAKRGCSPRAVQESMGHILLRALGHWERAQHTGMVLAQEGVNALHQLWSHRFAEQMSGGLFACCEFPTLPQLCWEHKYFSFVPVPNQLQHPAAVLVCFD